MQTIVMTPNIRSVRIPVQEPGFTISSDGRPVPNIGAVEVLAEDCPTIVMINGKLIRVVLQESLP